MFIFPCQLAGQNTLFNFFQAVLFIVILDTFNYCFNHATKYFTCRIDCTANSVSYRLGAISRDTCSDNNRTADDDYVINGYYQTGWVYMSIGCCVCVEVGIRSAQQSNRIGLNIDPEWPFLRKSGLKKYVLVGALI